MADDIKDAIKQLGSEREATIKELKNIIEQNQAIIKNTASTREEVKQATQDNKKANTERKSLEKQQVTLAGDLKKNFSDIGTTITGGLEGMMGETFGPLGGIASSLTVGFFKRSQENKKSLESDQIQVDSAKQTVEEMREGKTATTKIVKEIKEGEEGEEERQKEDAGGEAEAQSSMGALLEEQKKTTKAIKGGRETAEEEEKEDDKQHKALIDALKGIGGGKGGKGGDAGDDGGFFPGLTTIASVLGGIALGLVGGAWIPPVDELRKITSVFDTKFPKFTKGIRNFFGMKIPDVPKVPSVADDAAKVVAKVETWKDGVKTVLRNADGTFAKASDQLTEAAKGLKVGEQVAEGTGSGSKIAQKAQKLMGIEVPNFMKNIVTKLDDSVAGLKVAAESQGIVKTAAGLGVKMAGSVFGRVFAIAGNPIFDVAAMAKDAYDIAAPTMDKNVRTQAKAEDWGGLIGGVVGGALGTMIGMPWLGVGLGNMAGEFVGSLADNPDVVNALETTRTNLAEEATQLTTEVADLEAKIKELDPGSEMAKLMQAQLDSSKARLKIVTDEKAALEGPEVKAAEAALEAAGLKGDALAADIAKLEAGIAAAEEKGDTARVTFLERQLEITETEFDAAEANYVKKEDELRNATRNASATMAEDATNFFDRVATEGGFFGSIFSAFGAGLTEEEGGKQYLEKQIQKLQNDILAQETEIEGGDERNFYGKPRKIIIEGLNREITRLQERSQGLATGGFIVDRPAYLPSSGVVVGEHASWSGRGAAGGGFPPDGGPEGITSVGGSGAVVPLGSDRAGAFFKPIARLMGEELNAQMYAKLGIGLGKRSDESTNIIDASTTNVVNNTNIRTPSPSGPSLHFEGRDFVHKVA